MMPASAARTGAGEPGAALVTTFLAARILFAAIFILSGIGHLTRLPMMSQYAAAFEVPQPTIAVAVTGVMILLGGLSVLLGVRVRIGALLLFVFLIPVAIYLHPFWGVSDPAQAATQQAHFMKNLSLAGASLFIYYASTLTPRVWVYAVAP